MDAAEITFWRNAIALIPLIGGLIIFKRLHLLKTARPFGQLLRAIIGTAGMILSVWCLSYLSLSEAVAFGFTSPLFVVLLSVPLLGERVGWRRVLATMIGFSGVFIIIGQNPLALSLDKGAIIALCASACNALVMISLRWLGSTENSLTTVFYFFAFGLIGTGLAMPFIYTPIPEGETWVIGILGLVGLLSLILKTESYRRGAAAVIAPLSYVLILWAGVWDWFIWGTIPGWQVWLGAFVIMTSNLFILYREAKLNKAAHHPKG